MSSTNTLIHYLYRDAGNWKFRGSFFVKGHATVEDFAPFMFDVERFVPYKVGLKHLLTDSWTEDHHVLHEFEEFEETDIQEFVCTAEELIAKFREASTQGWFSGSLKWPR
jgi:peptidyl-tRNA hydrolase